MSGAELMEDGEKLKKFLCISSMEKISALIDKLESLNDPELNEYIEFLKSIFR
jgi:hypothetical protein